MVTVVIEELIIGGKETVFPVESRMIGTLGEFPKMWP